MINRNDLRARLKAKQPKPEPINVDGWGEGFFCRKLNGLEKYDYYVLAEHVAKADDRNRHALNKSAMVFLVSRCVCDEQGNRIWTDEEDGEIASEEFEALLSSFQQCIKINGIGDEKKEDSQNSG